MALQLKGEHQVEIGRDLVWKLMNDPAVLQEIIPGCETLNRISEDKYELGLNLLIGSVSGNYKGSVELSEKRPPDNYRIMLTGEGSIGFVKGQAAFVLTPKDDGTVISYDGEAEVGGLVAGIGNRVLGGIAKFMVKRFFKAFDKYVKEHGAVASGIIEARLEERVDVGGALLRVIIEGREGAPWLVMSHSIATDLHVWDAQVEALRDQFRILRFDTRGHGASDASPAPYDFNMLEQDVVKLLDHYGIDKAHFMGVSLGGMIGFGLAINHPERLASLIAVSSRADAPEAFRAPWDERIAAVKKDGMEALVKPTVERWFSPEYLASHGEIRRFIETMIRDTAVEGFAGIGRALQKLDYLPGLANISVPTLLIAGSRDAPIPDAMRNIHEAIRQSKFEIVADAGHLPNVEKSSGFNAIVAKFLAQQI